MYLLQQEQNRYNLLVENPINSGITPNLDTVGFWLHNIEFAAEAKFCVDATT